MDKMDKKKAKALAKLLEEAKLHSTERDDHKPSESHLAFIPEMLYDKVVEMTSVSLNNNAMMTLILGIVCSAYPGSMYKNDVKNWNSKFNTSEIHQVEFKSHMDSPELMDRSDAITKINEALERMNEIPNGSPVRLILVGPGHTQFILEAIKHLMKMWKVKDGERSEKKLCMVISGDTPSEENFELCKQLCLTGVCNSIHFYNTMYYNPFGYYNNNS